MILNSCGQERKHGGIAMQKSVKPKIVNFSDIEAKHGGTMKGNGFSIRTDTGIMSLTHRKGIGFGVRNKSVAIIGKLLSGPLASDDVQLGEGERVLKVTTGPMQNSVFYKFKVMSDGEKEAALKSLDSS